MVKEVEGPLRVLKFPSPRLGKLPRVKLKDLLTFKPDRPITEKLHTIFPSVIFFTPPLQTGFYFSGPYNTEIIDYQKQRPLPGGAAL